MKHSQVLRATIEPGHYHMTEHLRKQAEEAFRSETPGWDFKSVVSIVIIGLDGGQMARLFSTEYLHKFGCETTGDGMLIFTERIIGAPDVEPLRNKFLEFKELDNPFSF